LNHEVHEGHEEEEARAATTREFARTVANGREEEAPPRRTRRTRSGRASNVARATSPWVWSGTRGNPLWCVVPARYTPGDDEAGW